MDPDRFYNVQIQMLGIVLAQYGISVEPAKSYGFNLVFPGGMKVGVMQGSNMRYTMRPLNFGNGETLTNLTGKDVKKVTLKFLIQFKRELFKEVLNQGGSHGYDS